MTGIERGFFSCRASLFCTNKCALPSCRTAFPFYSPFSEREAAKAGAEGPSGLASSPVEQLRTHADLIMRQRCDECEPYLVSQELAGELSAILELDNLAGFIGDQADI